MRKLALKMSMALDGFVCGPNGEMDWFMKTRSDDGAAWTAEKISQAGAHLIAIGQGVGIFAKIKTPLQLKLIETKIFSAGTIGQIYRIE
jgi:hypothetical protein